MANKPNSFMKPMTLTPALQLVVGKGPTPRAQGKKTLGLHQKA